VRITFAVLIGALTWQSITTASADDNSHDWPMYNANAEGTRSSSAEKVLTRSSVGGLTELWRFATPAAVTGTPIVVGNMLYVGDLAGNLYALTRDGVLTWTAHTITRVTASAIVVNNKVIVGDLSGTIYGFDRSSGSLVWSVRPNSHPTAAIWGSGTKVRDGVAFGVASNEESATRDPSYHCCSMRGSIVLLNPKDGSTIWQTYTISDAQAAAGSSGASVWSTPTFDESSGLLYVTTGNNFSQPGTNTSDAILALDAHTGAIAWVNQRTPDDTWTYQFPLNGPDADFGDSAQVYSLPNGRRVVSAGQKSGFLHVLDAANGAVVNTHQYAPGGLFGGLFSDSAYADSTIFVNGHDWANTAGLPTTGYVVAVSPDGANELWRFSLPGTANMAGIAVANHVAYFASIFSGRLYALDAASGAQLASVPIGMSASGPSVSNGRVFVGVGSPLQATGTGAVVALGLPGHAPQN
jgi:outer membrane protein assembly factor BamB